MEKADEIEVITLSSDEEKEEEEGDENVLVTVPPKLVKLIYKSGITAGEVKVPCAVSNRDRLASDRKVSNVHHGGSKCGPISSDSNLCLFYNEEGLNQFEVLQRKICEAEQEDGKEKKKKKQEKKEKMLNDSSHQEAPMDETASRPPAPIKHMEGPCIQSIFGSWEPTEDDFVGSSVFRVRNTTDEVPCPPLADIEVPVYVLEVTIEDIVPL